MSYDIFLPSISVIMGYLGTYILYKTSIIKKKIHVNIWHFIIFVAVLISGGAGFLLVLLLDTGIALPINAQFLYWHVELGVTLVIVTIFHFHIYKKGFKAMLGLKKKGAKAWKRKLLRL